VTFCLEGHWRKCRYLVISDKKIIPWNRWKKWLFPTECQLFRGTENLLIPFRTLPGTILFRTRTHWTKKEENSLNSVPNYSVEENTTPVRLSPDRMGPLGKPPANLAVQPSRTSSHTRSYPALFKLQRRYEAILWLHNLYCARSSGQQETSGRI